jgi:hypothetical protein
MAVDRHAATTTFLSSRRREGQSDLLPMPGLPSEARSRTDDWHHAHVGELANAFFMVACHQDPAKRIRLWRDGDGKRVGYTRLGADPLIDW